MSGTMKMTQRVERLCREKNERVRERIMGEHILSLCKRISPMQTKEKERGECSGENVLHA